MVNGLVYAHSGWRYVVIIVALIVIVKMLLGWFGDSKWSTWDQRLGMAVPIVFDVQLLLGIVIWVVQQRWIASDALASWEHPVTMILAVAIAHITWSHVKKIDDNRSKYRTASVGFIVAGLVMALGVVRITS